MAFLAHACDPGRRASTQWRRDQPEVISSKAMPGLGSVKCSDDLVASVGLAGQANQKIRALSRGQHRRLDVAIGIVGRPEVLFLDEPSAGFDRLLRRAGEPAVDRLCGGSQKTSHATINDRHLSMVIADLGLA
jgi:ABC-type Fe3+/spermidine/putrescine transport system ATPase subunit